MSKQFFTILGDELCSIKNSPFFKLGQKGAGIDDPNILRSKLSYDPDRVFNRERYEHKNDGIEDQDFIEMIQEEKKEEEKIEFDLLREATREDFQRKIRELNLRNDEQTAPKQYTIFRSPRSFCRSCRKCSCYRGNFGRHALPWSADPSKSVEFLSCINCRCSMNSHELVRPINHNRKMIWNHMKSKRMVEEYLNVPYFVSAFVVSGEYQVNDELLEVAELLEKVGFKLKNYQVIEKWKFEMGLLRIGLLTHGSDPGIQETSMRLAECIAESGKWTDVAGQEFEQYFAILKKINHESYSKMLHELRDEDMVLLYLIETQNFNSPQQRKLLQSLEEYTKPASLLYLSNDKRQSILLAQQFFSRQFTLSTRLFLLPQGDSDENLLKFKDIIDYNGYYVLFENISNIRRVTAENLLNFLTYHEQTYIMGKDLASETLPKLPLIYTAKAGPHHLNHYGQLPSYLEVPYRNQQQVVKELFPDYCVGQRCVIVLRPLLAGSGFEEVIVNLLRVNNFTIIQRIRGALSLECAQYLAALEHITQEDLQPYLSLMTTGICEILIISKKSALYEAHALLNHSDRSLADINPRWLRNRPSIEIKRGKEVFKEDFNFPEIRNNIDVFSGASSLLNLNNCLFGASCEGRVRVLENCKTGELIKVAEDPEDRGGLKATLRQRQQILGELKKDNFNYLLFNSKSQKTTEELVSLFFPQCTLFESAVVLIKPSYLHLLGEIKQILVMLRYHIIFTKTVQLSRQFTEELIGDLQKLKMDHQTLREATELYSGQKIAFLCISKLCARKQMLFLLSNFNFLPNRTILQTDQSQQVLKEVLVPIWTNQERYLKVFNRHLSNLEEAVLLLTDESGGRLTPEDKQQLTEYFVGSIFANKPDASGNTSIGKLSLYCTESEMAKFQSWYYATLSNFYPNSVPLLFQYRMFGRATLVIQSHSGEPFMACIVNHYQEERLQQDKSKLSNLSDPEEKVKNRNSIVLLLWAKKIFKFIEELSILGSQTNKIPIQVEGWGRIIHNNNQYRAELTEVQCIEKDRRFLESIITRYPGNRHLLTNCKKMLESRILPQRYRFQNRRLLPNFNIGGVEQSIRVVERGDISKIYLKGEFEMIDPDNEKNTQTRSLLSLNLFGVCPYVASRYSLLAQILLFFDKWQEQALEYRQVFAGIFEHLQSFLGKYDDLEFLEFEIYMLLLEQLVKGEVTEDRLRVYPSLRKSRARGGEEVIGKNRKFLDQKQYFRPSHQPNEDALEEIRLKYTNFNLKTLEEPAENHILNNKQDFLHNQWLNQGNVVNLLREEPRRAPINEQRGVYVEYEKILNENEQRIKGQLDGQVQKLGNRKEETVLRDRGIDDEIWYKRVRSGIGKSGKVDEAISKQLQKLNRFKSSLSSNNTA